MYGRLTFISYTFAAVASLCFMSGIAVLSGGILLSASALFSGLAITVMTLKNDETIEDEENEEETYEDLF